ncbi:MAG: CpaF family protein [Micrococcales bacterium]
MPLLDDVTAKVRCILLEGQSASPEVVSAALDGAIDSLALAGVQLQGETELRARAENALTGFGVLQPLLDDASIEEVWINRPNQILFAKNGRVESLDCSLSDDDIRTLTLRMLRHSGRRVDTSLPFADAMLPDGSRLHVVIPDVTAKHWALNIRKFPAEVWGLGHLEQIGSLAAKPAEILRAAIADGSNVLISGSTHSGKTTLLCALLEELPASTRLVSCEETFEIRTTLADWVAMQCRQPNLEGKGEIPLRRLVKESLRMRPDRLVVGEVREAEALDLLVAMNSGVAGICTIHANSAAAAVTKLCTLPLLAGPNISSEFVRATVGSAIDLVVHCAIGSDGVRRVIEVARVLPGENGVPATERVWP